MADIADLSDGDTVQIAHPRFDYDWAVSDVNVADVGVFETYVIALVADSSDSEWESIVLFYAAGDRRIEVWSLEQQKITDLDVADVQRSPADQPRE